MKGFCENSSTIVNLGLKQLFILLCAFRPKSSDAHPKPSDAHPKLSDAHPKPSDEHQKPFDKDCKGMLCLA